MFEGFPEFIITSTPITMYNILLFTFLHLLQLSIKGADLFKIGLKFGGVYFLDGR